MTHKVIMNLSISKNLLLSCFQKRCAKIRRVQLYRERAAMDSFDVRMHKLEVVWCIRLGSERCFFKFINVC
jgi:hypothetical protein